MPVPFSTETWVWYSLVVGLIASRICSRYILLGHIKNLKLDDWLMIAILVPYTTLIVTINIVAHTSSNLIPPGVSVDDMSQQERNERIYGSKLILVVEQMQISTIWMVKACLLLFYWRLTANLQAQLYVKLLTAYVFIGYAVMEILYFGIWCRPFWQYWALPTNNTECTTALHHLIVNAAFNLSSDLVMLIIASSLFLRARLPWSRKIILLGIFGLGLFVVLAAVLNKYYSFAHPFGSQWTFWYVRESSTAMLVANLPYTWTLLRRIFKLGSFSDENSVRSVPYHSARSALGRHVSRNSNGRNDVRTAKTSSGASSSATSPAISLDMNNIDHTRRAATRSNTGLTRQPTWREQGLFGRGDLEIMADIESGAYAANRDRLNTRRPSNTETVGHPPSSGASSPRRDGTSSPVARRPRDVAAQYKMQSQVAQKKHFGGEEEEEEPDEQKEEKEELDLASRDFAPAAAPSTRSKVAAMDEEQHEGHNLEFHTSALDMPSEPPLARHTSEMSEERPRRSLSNKITPALFGER